METVRVQGNEDILKDYVLNLDDFNKQTVLKEERALINMFINLVMMEKGTVPKFPNLGFELHKKKHKLQKTSVLNEMEEELRNQVDTYLPGTMSNIKFRSENNKGDITIEAETVKGTSFGIEVSTDSDDMVRDLKIKVPDKEF